MSNVQAHYYRFHKERHVEAIPPSVIPYYDLTVVLQGSLEYRINNHRVSVGEGDVILMPPDTRRERFRTEGDVTYVSFNFRTQEPLSLPLLMPNGASKEVRMMIYACNEIDRDREDWRAAFESMTTAILHALKAQVSRSENSALTERILAYIRDHYKQPLVLRKIAKEMSYSVVYCDQAFKRDMGVSIVRYLIDYRIAKVKEFLMENILSLREIADRTGFADTNYLSRQFRRRTGISPLRFRKEFNR